MDNNRPKRARKVPAKFSEFQTDDSKIQHEEETPAPAKQVDIPAQKVNAIVVITAPFEVVTGIVTGNVWKCCSNF